MLVQSVIEKDVDLDTTYSFSVTSTKVAQELAEKLGVVLVEEVVITGEQAHEGETMVLRARVTPARKDDQFRWFMGEKLLKDQTAETLTLAAIPYAMNGVKLSCQIIRRGKKGVFQKRTSVNLVVQPRTPTVLTSQPPQAVKAGSVLRLTANGTNAYDEGYQWYFNDDLLVGETAPTLLLENVDLSKVGCYRFQVMRAGKALSCEINVDLRS